MDRTTGAERKAEAIYSVMAVGKPRDDGGLGQSHGNKHEEVRQILNVFWEKS